MRSQTGAFRRAMKIASVVILVLLVGVILLSQAFVFTHANHEHDHNTASEQCMTCVQLQTAESIIKALGAAIGAVLFAMLALLAATIIPISCFFQNAKYTLTHQKIRLNN